MQSGMNQVTSTKMTREFLTNLKLDDEEKERGNHQSKEQEAVKEDDYDTEEEEEFSFSLAFDGVKSPITAEDAFSNGQIKPIFPLFDQNLLLQENVVMENSIANDRLINVKKVFIEAGSLPAATASTFGNGDAAERDCHFEKKEAEVALEVCKKSYSTGFSKFWKFRDFMRTSSSDGRDAFVFLKKTNNKNKNTTSSGITRSGKKKAERAARKAEKKKKNAVAETTVNGDEGKVKVAYEKGKAKAKSREQDHRRSYLPHLPEKVGFFTKITGGGLTKNVHPF